MIALKQPILIVMVLFGCCFHCCTQGALNSLDPGAVHASLKSLEEGMDDERTTAVFEELMRTPPTVKVVAEAYHTETETTGTGSNSSTTTRTVIDHREEQLFAYASWKDVSGHVTGLDDYKVAAVEVVPQIECSDMATT